MKFMDIVSQSNSVKYFLDNYGNVVPEKFYNWWFMDYEKIIEDLNNPPEKKQLLFKLCCISLF